MISFEQARARMLAAVAPLSTERVPTLNATGRVLSEPVAAKTAQPPFAYSAMDGYAVSSADVLGAGPFQLEVWGESRTGRPSPVLRPGTACAISTGAELPAGADAVVPREQTERVPSGVELRGAVAAGQHVRVAGEDLALGAEALAAGTRLGPAAIGLLCALDTTRVAVTRRPRVAVLCTGDELRAPGSAHVAGKIPDSISAALAALATQAGGIVQVLPYVADEEAATHAAVRDALADVDVLLTVGGMSVGEHDWVRSALDAAGVKLEFFKVAIKPGKPLAFGRSADGSVSVLGLPGNPASALVTFALFGVPLLRSLQGDRAPLPRPLRLRLGAKVQHKLGRLELARVELREVNGETLVFPFKNQAAGALTTLAWADALALVPADVEELEAGASVELYRLQDL